MPLFAPLHPGTPLSSLSPGLAWVGALASLVLGAAPLLGRHRSFASACFSVGMMVFGCECIFQALSLRAAGPKPFVFWQDLTCFTQAFLPGVWLAFSLSYSRGNSREFLRDWRLALGLAAVLPPLLALGFFGRLVTPVALRPSMNVVALALSPAAKGLNALVLVGILVILTNFERTFRATVGTMRWRVKFLLLGLCLIFSARVYTGSLALLFSRRELPLIDVETGTVLIGSLLIGVGQLRRGFSEVEVYPSHAFLRNSLTFVLAGCYLFVVGVLAQLAKWVGGSATFQIQALITLTGIAGLGVLLSSERLRQRVRSFVSRHLRRPAYDFRLVWHRLTQRLADAPDAAAACTATAQLVSETFSALSVTVWLLDEQGRWVIGASTSEKGGAAVIPEACLTAEPVDLPGLAELVEPFDLEKTSASWATTLREANRQQFAQRSRLAVVLRAGRRVLGVTVLGDRVYGLPYTVEERELLKCLVDQLAATLLNFRLGQDLAQARELETFQTMSAFFAHDLKNSTSSLNLMLQNLPQHFDNPEFREDALRGLARTTERINGLIARLAAFRDQLDLHLQETDLNALVAEVVGQLGPRTSETVQETRLTRPVRVDREQIRGVVTNLLTNAHEASLTGGTISVRTETQGDQAVLTVRDDGCGMTPEFLQKSLFRPFQTTKKKGIGIGMFQTRMIVEAHRGQIQVRSKPGQGTTFQVKLPF